MSDAPTKIGQAPLPQPKSTKLTIIKTIGTIYTFLAVPLAIGAAFLLIFLSPLIFDWLGLISLSNQTNWSPPLQLVIIGFVVATNFFLHLALFSTVFFDNFEKAEVQKVRDNYAKGVFEKLPETDRKFALFLRGFVSTNQVKSFQGRDVLQYLVDFVLLMVAVVVPFASLAIGKRQANVELEEALHKACEPVADLVAIGRHGEHNGAGRIEVDDDHWQDAVDQLCDAANLIFIIPHDTPGTMWEIEKLLTQDMMKKVLVVKPPRRAKLIGNTYDPRKHWPTISKAFRDHGYDLPAVYGDDWVTDRYGEVIYFGSQKTPVFKLKIDIQNVNEFYQNFALAYLAHLRHV